MNCPSAIRLAVAATFVAAMAGIAAYEAPVARMAFGKGRRTPVKKRIAAVQRTCAEEMPLRFGFVTLNGHFVRALGQRKCNDVYLSETGIAFKPGVRNFDCAHDVRKMQDFAAACSKWGVRFLYVQLSKKMDMGNRMCPPGIEDKSHDNASNFLDGLAAAHIPHVDWRQQFALTPEDVRRNFFKTDHHWNNEAAFRAAGLMLEEIGRRCDVRDDVLENARRLLDRKSWKKRKLPDFYLGSDGRRTGAGFAGLDDLVLLYPRFKTDMTLSVSGSRTLRKGSFEKTVMARCKQLSRGNPSRDENDKAYTSIGGRRSVVRFRNPGAPVDLKVVCLGDSFSRAPTAFLSVAVRDLTVVDPRQVPRAFLIADLVRREKPDIVLQVLNTSTLTTVRSVDGRRGEHVMFQYGLPSNLSRSCKVNDEQEKDKR